MKKILTLALLALFSFSPTHSFAGAEIGKKAPDFKLVDSDGKTHELTSFKGKTVVLEWLNFECPFVRKHYDTGNMQKIQTEEIAKGTVWLSIISSAKGKQGYLEGKELKERMAKEKIKSSFVLLDSEGTVGKAYDAKTTPHMYIIDPNGTLVYRGAIDDMPSTDKEDVTKSKNYVKMALDELRAGKKVATSDTKPYGCGVKYK